MAAVPRESQDSDGNKDGEGVAESFSIVRTEVEERWKEPRSSAGPSEVPRYVSFPFANVFLIVTFCCASFEVISAVVATRQQETSFRGRPVSAFSAFHLAANIVGVS